MPERHGSATMPTMRPLIFFPLLFVLLMLSAKPALAEWTLVDKGNDGTDVYVDYESVRKNGNFRRVWAMAN